MICVLSQQNLSVQSRMHKWFLNVFPYFLHFTRIPVKLTEEVISSPRRFYQRLLGTITDCVIYNWRNRA